jgi:peptidoglycan/LPS O-acetylase OafA/YrhL
MGCDVELATPGLLKGWFMNRNRSLDGMRGLAALAVLFHHVLMSTSIFANSYFENQASSAAMWALTFTPLRLLWAGPEAVTVFFVISGIALASLYQKLHSYTDYAKSRLLRLYVPSIFLGIICVVLSMAFSGDLVHPTSAWLARVTPEETISAGQLTLRGIPGLYTLWSTRLEIIFSLAIPLAILITRKFKPVTLLVLLPATSYLGFAFMVNLDVVPQLLAYGPFFVFGVAIKTRPVELSNFLKAKPTILLLFGFVLISLKWLVATDAPFLAVVQGCGASILVLAVTRLEHPNRFLESRVAQWLGVRSFSLYLAHGPVVYFFAYLFGSSPLALTLMVVAAIAFTELVERLVIRPTHRAARQMLH